MKRLTMSLPVLVFSFVLSANAEKFDLSNEQNIKVLKPFVESSSIDQWSDSIATKISDIKSLLVSFNFDIEKENIELVKFVLSLKEKKTGYICHDDYSRQNLDSHEDMTTYSIVYDLSSPYVLSSTLAPGDRGLKNRDLRQDKVPDGGV